jgi:hypothetical protein
MSFVIRLYLTDPPPNSELSSNFLGLCDVEAAAFASLVRPLHVMGFADDMLTPCPRCIKFSNQR